MARIGHVVLLLAALLLAWPARAAPAVDASLRERLDRIVTAEMQRAHVPGVAVAVVWNGRVVALKGYGQARLDPARPMTPNTVVRAGSVSKVMTGLAVVDMADRGIIALDRDINNYLTHFKVSGPAGQTITPWHLLTHTAGFDDTIIGLHTYDRSHWKPLLKTLVEDLPRPVMPPGEVISYSSYSMGVLGGLLEARSGQPFARYMERHIFTPLGMSNTTFEVATANFAPGLDQAVGYRWDGRRYVAYPYNYVRLAPGIALRTTARDMSKFLLAMLGDDGSAISARARAAFTAPAVAHYRGARGRALGPSEQFLRGYRALFHDGNGIGFSSRVYWIPSLDFGLFVSANHALLDPGLGVSAGSEVPANIVAAVLEATFPQGHETPLTYQHARYLVVPPASAVVNQGEMFAGYFVPTSRSRSSVQKIGALFGGRTVAVSPAGVTIDGRQFNETSPGALSGPNGATAYMSVASSGRPLLIIDNNAFERASAWETPKAQAAAAIILVAASIAACILWLTLLRRRLAPRSLAGTSAFLSWIPVAAIGGALAHLLTMDPQQLYFGTPKLLVAVPAVLVLGWLAIAYRAVTLRRLQQARGRAAAALAIEVASLVIASAMCMTWHIGP